jgi:hypothetical protein
MKLTYKSVFSYLRIAFAGTLVLTAAGFAYVAVKTSSLPATEKVARPVVSITKKGDIDLFKPGRNAEAVPGPESRNPDSSPDIEAYKLRAYPADEISIGDTIAAQNGFAQLNASAHSPGTWQPIGPSKATYPQVLDPFLFDGAQYVASGRVTAIAISPNCNGSKCTLYVAAAGGGIWRTDQALNGSNWQFVSGSFATNAIGSLVIDPNDASGNTLYAGTGEPNVSVDSEAGMGIYKSTDGGMTWVLLPGSVAASSNFQGRAVSSIAIDPTHPNIILAGIARAVRGVSSTDGAATSNPPAPVASFGVYKSTDGGATFTNMTPGAFGSVRGVNDVAIDPNNSSIYYTAVLGAGVWRSSNGGATWTQIKNPLNTPNNFNNTDRSGFALANAAGTTRMYVGQGASGGPAARFYKALNAQTATNASFVDMTTAQNIGYCTGQCWYDNVVYSPPGAPDVVYLGGSFSYGQLHGVSNGRAWLLSTDAGVTWSDLTQDGSPNHANAIHPDQHAIVTVPGSPFLFITGSDGGVVRSDGSFADVAYKCDARGLNAADTAFCKSLLFRVPNQQINMNNGLETLQFQSLSVSSQRPQNNLQGGTQDNGTFQFTGSNTVSFQEIYGDGGQSGFKTTDDSLRFNTFSGQANDANFRNGDPTEWVIISANIIDSPEGSLFYPPIIADPNAANAASIFQGSFSVWRTQDWGGNQAFLEANCPEFTASAFMPGCGDFVPIGPSGATDLTGAAYSAPAPARAGGAVIVISRSAANTGTAWVATTGGRVFITSNANDPAGSVVWTRIDNKSGGTSPGRVPTGIAIDPANPNHARISYSGYDGTTPLQPGHVFDVTWNGVSATWTNISYNLPNLPITAIVRDDVTGDLYAASDFGVMKLPSATTAWGVAGSGLPMVEVPGLTINSSARLLYAATHGRSGWLMTLP